MREDQLNMPSKSWNTILHQKFQNTTKAFQIFQTSSGISIFSYRLFFLVIKTAIHVTSILRFLKLDYKLHFALKCISPALEIKTLTEVAQ